MKAQIGWVFSGICIAIILYLQMCPAKKPDVVGRSQFQAMEARLKDTTKYYQQLLKADSGAFQLAADNAKEQDKLNQKDKAALNESQNQVQRLSDKIAAAKQEQKNDTWIPVSPNYIDGCDSLRLQAIAQSGLISQYQEGEKKSAKLLNYEIGIRDTALQHRQAFNAALQKQLDACISVVQKGANRPRTQLYGGIGLLGNKINPLAGGQVNISLKTKGSQIYEITGAAVGGTWYVGAGAKFLFHF